MEKINKLVIIAGPSCAGKSFLINKMSQKKGDPDFMKQELLDKANPWFYIGAYGIPYINEPVIDRLVIHYDLFAHYTTKKGFNYLEKLILNSNSITVLSLCTTPEILTRRVRIRLISKIWSYTVKNRFKALRKLHFKYKTYKERSSVFNLYENWFNFIENSSVSNHWAMSSGSAQIMISKYNEDSWELIKKTRNEITDIGFSEIDLTSEKGLKSLCRMMDIELPLFPFPGLDTKHVKYWDAPTNSLRIIFSDIDKIIEPKKSVILVSNYFFKENVLKHRKVFNLMERDGKYWGKPKDSKTAITELERLRDLGANFIIFLSFSFWWLSYYEEFGRYLSTQFNCLHRNNNYIIFDLEGKL